MECYEIGNIMRDARRRHGLTQEELAFGICSVSTLSKIENGRSTPQCRVFEALMQRMGEPGGKYISYIGKWKLKRRLLMRQMRRLIWRQDVNKMQELLYQYETIPGKENLLEQQERKLMEAVTELYNDTAAGTVCQKLIDALIMTCPDFDENNMPDMLYTYNETMILQAIACCYQNMGRYGEAGIILSHILQCQQQNISDTEWNRDVETTIYYQLAELHFRMGQHRSSAEFCARGIQKCLQEDRYHFLSILLAQRARIMAELGDVGESHLAEMHARLLNEILTNQNYLSKFL